ncbi:MAG TPA: ABC transporter substrate-binding protein [Micromonosporaceae bacterium]
MSYLSLLRPLPSVLIATTLLLASLTGCGGDRESSSAERPGPKRAEELTIAVATDEGTLTPYTQNTGYPGSNLVALIYDKLLELDEKNQPQPLLAQSMRAAPDNKTFTLTLRDGVTWHDGEPFGPDDVVFSVDYYKKHTVADSAPQLQDVKDVTVDGNRVVFTLGSADPEFPSRLLADMRILPEHVWSTIDKPENATAEQAIGTGPYKLVSYKKDQGYELQANPDYAMGTPKLDKIRVSIIPEQQTALAALRTGEVDTWSRTVPEEQAKGLERQRGIKIVRGPGFASTLLAFNNARKPFDNPEVRRAIAQAIDVDKIIETVLRGRAERGNPGFWHPDAPGADPALGHVYDVAGAKEALDAAGATPGGDGIQVLDGKPLNFTLLVYSVSPERIRVAELIRDMLKQVGIGVTVNSLDADSVDAKVWPGYDVTKGRDYDMAMWGWSAPVMLDTTMLPAVVDSDTTLGRLNITGTKDPQLDQLADRLRAATTLEERHTLLGDMQRRLAEIVPFVTLYYPDGAYAYRQDVFDGWVYQDGAGILNKMSYVDLRR